MNIHFIKSSQKKEILAKLNEQFGILELPYLLIESGKEKFRAFSGHLSKDEISHLSQILRIELIGLYLLKQEVDFRLSIDASNLLAIQINKNIASITNEQLHEWLRGNDLPVQAPRGVVAIKHNNDFIGCGKSNGEKIFNYVPKDRRLKK